MAQAILSSLQNEFLKKFFASPVGPKFFLTGGTALSVFYLKHRVSYDLDLFALDQDLNFDEVSPKL